MGQIPNKTYTAPDGSVYRVESDGSVTKIKGGRVQSNEPPSKYQITPDGKIYKVESDGSVTYLGNAEDRATSQPSYTNILQEPQRKSNSWIWIITVIIVVGIICAIAYSNMNDYNPTDVVIQEESTAAPSVVGTSSESKVDDNDPYAFICDGNYYGTIGNSRINGNLTLNTENPSGSLYYSKSESTFYIYGTSDCRDWTEYYNDEPTGTIHFDYWNLSSKNFAKGTYTRNSDGKRFSVKLYKSNF